MSVARCQQEVSAEEFTEWVAFHSLDPWSGTRMDWGFAMIACIVANANRAKGRKFTLQDFLPDWEKAGERQTPEQHMAAIDRALAIAGGAK